LGLDGQLKPDLSKKKTLKVFATLHHKVSELEEAASDELSEDDEQTATQYKDNE